jgi:hypothetical protein
MATEDPELLKRQLALVERMRKARDVLSQMAEEANTLGLAIAARECDYASKELDKGLNSQIRALKGPVPEGFK